MRIITEKICWAFERGFNMRIGNSRSENNRLYLHDNLIAEYRDGVLWITNAGWQTPTTKERLNGLNGVRIVQRQGNWYLNGNYWGGEWTRVDSNRNTAYVEPTEETDEIEYDLGSEWIATGKYSKPIYSVFHTLNADELSGVEEKLNSVNIPNRRMESDTDGEYKPHYFIVVEPKHFNQAKNIIK